MKKSILWLISHLSIITFFLAPISFGFLGGFFIIKATPAEAQIEPPDSRYLFSEDRNEKKIKKEQRQRDNQKTKVIKSLSEEAGQLPFDIDAKSTRFNSAENTVEAEGGVTITYSSAIIEADKAKVNVGTNDAELLGDVRISDPTGSITADSAQINLKSGSGEMSNADAYFKSGDYQLTADKMNRYTGDVYVLEDTTLTTCKCPEGGDCPPWRLSAKRAKITRDGYGHVWNCTMDVHGVPVMYLPYFFFPAKTERQTGFLPPSFSIGSQAGFSYFQPFFWAIDKSTDLTLTSIYESNVRYGAQADFRKIFSKANEMEMGGTFVNESWRNGDLLGTNIDGLSDPTIDENRKAAYLNHNWDFNLGNQPVQYIMDGAYVSDDLVLRELDEPQIGDKESRFVTSRAVLRTSLFETFTAEVNSEYNQSLVEDDDFVLQRLPSAVISGFNTARLFGENALGLKLGFEHQAFVTNFERTKSSDGLKAEAFERIKLPFHYRNFFDGELSTDVRATEYNLDQTLEEDIGTGQTRELDDSSNRIVPGIGSSLSSVVEKVYPISENNLIKTLGELGPIGRREKLVRLKHTVEPGVRYRYVPFVNQMDNPQFDSNDQLAQRNVVTYGVTQRLYGRYEPRDTYRYGIEEATPELEDFESLKSPSAFGKDLTFGVEPPTSGAYQGLRTGSVVELARLSLKQSFDIVEDRNDDDPDREPLSDLGAGILLLPNYHVRFRAGTNFDVQESDFKSYSIESQFIDKRGDEFRLRFSFVDPEVRQLETSTEFVLTERIKLGHYGFYDDLTGEFIENRGGVRISSSCNCWLFDVFVSDEINPDQTSFAFKVTLIGLGELGNTLFTQEKDSDRT